MHLIDNNGAMLRTLARVCGVSSIQATTDTPAAKIELSYQKRGIEQKSSFTVKELLDVFSERTTDARTHVPPGYTDISDIP